MSATVQITRSPLPLRNPLDAALRSGRLQEEIGRETVKVVRDNFLSLPANERGFPTTRFWPRAADATTYEVVPNGARVRVNQVGVRQRLLGGDINPVRAKFLTIPAIAETYGHRAGDFSGLKVVRGVFQTYTGRFTSLALVPRNWQARADDRREASGVYFWLVRHVSQPANPAVMPTNRQLLEAALRAVDRYLDDVAKNGGQP